MTLRILNAALIGEHRNELVPELVGVGELLLDPPGILATRPVVVIAASHPVHVSRVDHVAISVNQRAVPAAVAGNFGMAVKLAAHDLQDFAAGCYAIAAHMGDVRKFR